MSEEMSQASQASQASQTQVGRIAREPVASSSIAAFGYDEASRILEVEFPNGSVYRYFGVPASVYGAMKEAASVGMFFHAMIRNRFASQRAY